jgi:uncharacterized protein (DUF1501 family)
MAGTLSITPAWMPRVTLAPPHVGPRGDTLVCIFLRGGADGLNIIVPHGDDAYYANRPTIAIPRPDDARAKLKAVDLDGFFGLHPSLSALSEVYKNGHLAVVHATGAPDETRSHFEAMAFMERGAIVSGEYSGWLARHLSTLDTGNVSALRAVGISEILPASLSGAVSSTALRSLSEYHLDIRAEATDAAVAALQGLYANPDDLLTTTATSTFEALGIISKLGQTPHQPAGRAYPETDFGKGLTVISQLINANVGVEVACLDMIGWDTHAAQGAGEGLMGNLLAELGNGLAAFYDDMQSNLGNVTVLVMSEFGRRVNENGALGTDHGHANMMMVLGGGINGGKTYARWPGLAPDQIIGPGDLALTTDYRDVLSEVIAKRLNNPGIDLIFPGYQPTPLDIAKSRV